jgi:hypothetical protein
MIAKSADDLFRDSGLCRAFSVALAAGTAVPASTCLCDVLATRAPVAIFHLFRS